MDNFALHVKDIVIEADLPEYQRGIDFFFSELVELNTNIYVLDQILQFPFDIFAGSDNTIFFSSVVRNSYVASLLIITRLATDTDSDLYTLSQFKNNVRRFVRTEYKQEFQERLRQIRFDQEARMLFKKAKRLRDKWVAHTSQDVILGDIKLTRLDLSELKQLRDCLNLILNALSFNVENMLLPVPYSLDVKDSDVGRKTDIEELLDSVARNSSLFNMPERYPGRWVHRQKRLNTEQLKVLNEYRRKFNLPEV